jgi:hypothetical protein
MLVILLIPSSQMFLRIKVVGMPMTGGNKTDPLEATIGPIEMNPTINQKAMLFLKKGSATYNISVVKMNF